VSDLHDAVRALVADTVLPRVEAWDRADDLPDAVVRELVGLGVTGAINPTGLATALLVRHFLLAEIDGAPSCVVLPADDARAGAPAAALS
jgi:hypothetical protein